MSADKIILSKLKVDAIIGVYDYERTTKQPIEFDITLTTDTAKAADADDISHALNYAEISNQIIEWVQDSQFQLIEALSNHIAEKLLATFPVQAVELTLRKFPRDLPVEYIGVEVRRSVIKA